VSNFVFYLVATSDWLLPDCDESRCEKSWMGVPYPKPTFFAQSLLDTPRFTDLADSVDGVNLSEDWGENDLNLERFVNVDYAKRKDEKIIDSIWENDASCLRELINYPESLRSIWQRIVRGKKDRLGPESEPELYHTRFFPIGKIDPRLEHRTTC
jgi:hypothetical protein